MGAGAIHGHQESCQQTQSNSSSSSTHHSYTSEESEHHKSTCANHNNKNVMRMSCEMCSSNFTFFKRKKFCKECHRYFCSTCLPKPPSSSPVGRQCRKCLVLISGHFTRDDLQNWKIKDMRCFLDVRKVSTKGCREKHDLVELVLSQFCKERRNSLEHQAEHDLLVQQMAARLTMDDARDESTHYASMDNGDDSHGVAGITDRAYSPGSSEERPSASSTRRTISESQMETDVNREERSDTHFTSLNSQELRDFLQSQVQEILNAEMAQREVQSEADVDTTSANTEPPSLSRFKLDEVKSLEDIDSLSVRQLKELLVNNFVNYKGCCEKPELIQRVKRLWNNHQENKIKAERIHKTDEEGTSVTVQDGEDHSAIPIPESSQREDNPQQCPAALSPSSLLLDDASSVPTPSSSPSKRVITEDTADSLCRVCMDALTNCILLECGHMVTCTTCGKQLAECPICRQYISRVVRVFRS